MDQLRRLGLEDAAALREAESRLAPGENDNSEVWPCNEEVVRIFKLLGRHWNFGGMDNQRICLNYQEVESYLRLMKVKQPKRIMKGLIIMEHAALEVIK